MASSSFKTAYRVSEAKMLVAARLGPSRFSHWASKPMFMSGDAAGASDRSQQKPEMFQLEHVQKRLEHTVPLMFRERLDYTFYHKDVIVDNQIIQVQRQGIHELQGHLSTFSIMGQVFFPHIEMSALSILPIIDDGTVRLRWRISYVSFLRALNPMFFKYEYRIKNLKWYDGYSVFHVDGNGMVYKFTIQKTMPDDSSLAREKTTAQKIAERIGVLPGGAANISVFVARPREESRRRD